MSKGIYAGVNSVARKAKTIYVGVNGVARKVSKIYVGVNNVARLCYSALTKTYAYNSPFSTTKRRSISSGVTAIVGLYIEYPDGYSYGNPPTVESNHWEIYGATTSTGTSKYLFTGEAATENIVFQSSYILVQALVKNSYSSTVYCWPKLTSCYIETK